MKPTPSTSALLAVALAAMLTGCSPVYHERYIPTTPEERKAVAAEVEHILAATPRTLSGHDQDWDDAIAAAQRAAAQTHVRPTFWEWNCWTQSYTGKWFYVPEATK